MSPTSGSTSNVCSVLQQSQYLIDFIHLSLFKSASLLSVLDTELYDYLTEKSFGKAGVRQWLLELSIKSGSGQRVMVVFPLCVDLFNCCEFEVIGIFRHIILLVFIMYHLVVLMCWTSRLHVTVW